MQHFRSLEDVHLSSTWVTIGSFDGVHLGHQALIRRMVAGAHADGCLAVVVTFFPHPVKFLRNLIGPYYLTTPDQRAEQLALLGVDATITLSFDQELAAQTAGQFMRNLVEHTNLKRLWVGHDFALGRGREGTVERLQQLGEQLGYQVEVMEAVDEGGEVISSSRIRNLIQSGDVAAAASLLGRNYRITGQVVHGDGRGRSLGIPTANLDVWAEQIVPANGIYATLTWVGGVRYPSATNVGMRPTFEPLPPAPRVEAYLMGYSGNLYGQTIDLDFVERLRPELKFDSISDLIEQMHQDIRQAEEILSHVP